MTKKIVTFGEVLLRLSTQSHERLQQASAFDVHYGGSEANVSVALATWGRASLHASALPDNALGLAAKQSLNTYGVSTQHVQFGDGRMALYFLENGASVRASKVLYDRYDSAFALLDPNRFDWQAILAGASWFHWSGITPAISLNAAKACLEAVTTARSMGIKISGDINYRRVLWQYGKEPQQIMPELISLCDVLVGGKTDFENCLDIVPKGSNDPFISVCEQVQAAYPAVSAIANTVRETVDASTNDLVGIIWKNKTLHSSQTYRLSHIVDRIGSGDAFMAGLIHQLVDDKSAQQVIEFATAAAAFKHTLPGDVLMATATEIEQLVQGVNIGKLLR